MSPQACIAGALTQAGGAVWQLAQAGAACEVQPLQGGQVAQGLWQRRKRTAAAQVQLAQVRQAAQAVWQARQAAAACMQGELGMSGVPVKRKSVAGLPVKFIHARACQPSRDGSACRARQTMTTASVCGQHKQHPQRHPYLQAMAAKEVHALEGAAVCHILCKPAVLRTSCRAANSIRTSLSRAREADTA